MGRGGALSLSHPAPPCCLTNTARQARGGIRIITVGVMVMGAVYLPGGQPVTFPPFGPHGAPYNPGRVTDSATFRTFRKGAGKFSAAQLCESTPQNP